MHADAERGIVRSADMNRTDRELLQRHGYLVAIIKGWPGLPLALRAALAECSELVQVAVDEGLLLCARPSLDLSFATDCLQFG